MSQSIVRVGVKLQPDDGARLQLKGTAMPLQFWSILQSNSSCDITLTDVDLVLDEKLDD